MQIFTLHRSWNRGSDLLLHSFVALWILEKSSAHLFLEALQEYGVSGASLCIRAFITGSIFLAIW